jgi:hypothetical protein
MPSVSHPPLNATTTALGDARLQSGQSGQSARRLYVVRCVYSDFHTADGAPDARRASHRHRLCHVAPCFIPTRDSVLRVEQSWLFTVFVSGPRAARYPKGDSVQARENPVYGRRI